MAEAVVATVDATGMTDLLAAAEARLGIATPSGSGSLGPFGAAYQASYFFAGGAVTLTPPNVVGIANCTIHYSVSVQFSLDLNKVIPPLCLPSVCVHIPFDGQICFPGVCITWPVITMTIPTYTDSVKFTADFVLNPHLVATPNGAVWAIDVVIIGVPTLDVSAAAAGLLAAIGLAVAAVVATVPLIGPVLAVAIAAIMAVITLAAVLGFLGALVTPFVSGLTFNVYKQPQNFQLTQGLQAKIQSLTAIVDAADHMVANASLVF